MRRRAAIVLLPCLTTLPAFGEDDYERIRLGGVWRPYG